MIFLCQATRVQEKIEHQMLSNANIQTISTYHHPKTHSNESIDLTEHEETRPPSQHQGNVIQPRPEHQAYIQEETIIFEESIPLNISSLSVSKANESRDSGISLNQSQIYQHPTPLDPLEESYSSSDSDSSSYTPLRIQKEPPISEEEYSSAQSLPPEPLPTQVLTTIDNEAPYSPSMVHISVTRPLHAPDQVRHSPLPIALAISTLPLCFSSIHFPQIMLCFSLLVPMSNSSKRFPPVFLRANR